MRRALGNLFTVLAVFVTLFLSWGFADVVDRGDLSGERQPVSTRAMNARVNQAWLGSDSLENFYLSERAVAAARRLVASQPDLSARLKLLHTPERYLLYGGLTGEALAEHRELSNQIDSHGVQLSPQEQRERLMFEAVCHLRLGEQENCLNNHNADSCLFPIRGAGVHQIEEGSRGAIARLEEILSADASDLEAQWLLNIAYMTLGEYPQRVPKAWRIDPAVFESDHDVSRFPDVAGNMGLAVDDLAGGIVMDDFDRDGLLDLMVSGSGPESPLRLFRNSGDGSFEDRTSSGGLEGVTGGLNMVQGDYDNDGFVDVLVLRTGWLRGEGLHPNSLLRNNGDFTFTDVTVQAGLDTSHPTQTAVWFDFNGDGWLDLFVGNETWDTEQKHPCELFRNNRDGTFTDIARPSRLVISKYVKAVVSGDYNNDGRPDLYLSVMGGANILLRNEGPGRGDTGIADKWRFRNVARQAGVVEPVVSFPSWFWDYDNDGWLDLFVSGYFINDSGDVAADYMGRAHGAETARLYRNLGDGRFEDVTTATGLNTVLHTMGSNFGDLDNDGWLDFYAGTGAPEYETLLPSRMFRGDSRGSFQDVTTSGGFGQLQKGHGIAFGDLDNDGDQDVYSVVGGVLAGDHYPNQLFENPGHGQNWLKLDLEGVESNRLGQGARIKIVVQMVNGSRREIHRTVGSGGSFGASPLRQEVGLGRAKSIDHLMITWPNGDEPQRVSGLELDRSYRIREGDSQVIEVQLPVLEFQNNRLGGSHHHHE